MVKNPNGPEQIQLAVGAGLDLGANQPRVKKRLMSDLGRTRPRPD